MSSNEPKMNGENKTPESNLVEELRELGKQLNALLRTIRESPRSKEFEQQVVQALRDVEKQVNDAVNKVQAPELKSQLKQTAATAKSFAGVAADEAQRNLARGLRSLNERMAQEVSKAQRASTQSGTAGSEDPGRARTSETGEAK